ncbi:hypothetical protein PFAG_04822 [Plasmodium falciparum Santa Lucia]|uniref:Uncharacterized protein n=2 Tax=Plasmodium falciparum TaxID=5833 RepID=A0A024W202_PLAFA|nr:hypothetical protein PFTANZ_04696 [Plasmodium falciparum Tanzania (2000708)]EUT80178.1 hypothetical protein PFAG_04822 [Plasmodium falciparum Santa Lucia]
MEISFLFFNLNYSMFSLIQNLKHISTVLLRWIVFQDNYKNMCYLNVCRYILILIQDGFLFYLMFMVNVMDTLIIYYTFVLSYILFNITIIIYIIIN